MTTPIRYLEAVRRILDHLEKTQLSVVEKAADLVIAALSHGGTVHCHGIGHGTEGDFINRAGGLAAVQPFTFGLNVNDPVPDCLKDRPRAEPFERDLETVRFAVKASALRAGDVMMLGSVSGKNRGPIELALACRASGVKVIGLTSMEYTGKVKSLHPSGKKLCEVVDVAIDNGAPYGDAVVAVPGFRQKVAPLSSLTGVAIVNSLVAEVVARLVRRGITPPVFMSANVDGADEFNERLLSANAHRIHYM